ncbi:hypothetical protein EDB85DRAFT_1895663 [Lactarius pseudohatsudake]|nr:hypothetical protein EDB85DRAFT_1895663 [Lactarius pseudohatsudake]
MAFVVQTADSRVRGARTREWATVTEGTIPASHAGVDGSNLSTAASHGPGVVWGGDLNCGTARGQRNGLEVQARARGAGVAGQVALKQRRRRGRFKAMSAYHIIEPSNPAGQFDAEDVRDDLEGEVETIPALEVVDATPDVTMTDLLAMVKDVSRGVSDRTHDEYLR